MWDIQLLGGLVVRSSERVVTRFRYHKAGSLLGYLAYFNHPHTPPHPREGLIEMLWPEVAPEAGHKNLRNMLSALRPVLEPPGIPPGAVLSADRFSVRLNPAAVTCDVHQFEASVRGASAPELLEAERMGAWMKAAQLYQGSLLPGYYEEWIGPESLRLSSLFLEVALQTVPLLLLRGKSDLALPLAQRAVVADPLSEAATWALMQVLAAQQQPSQALRAYRELERKLKQEWEETPSEELRAYVLQLKKSSSLVLSTTLPEEMSPIASVAPVSAKLSEPVEPERGKDNARLLGAAFTVLTNTRFFGREVETGRLIQMLGTHRTRLVTVTGPGGTGKTRLALEATARLMASTEGDKAAAQRAVFVALGEVTAPERICEAILRALGGRPIADLDPLEQVSAALSEEQQILLVLDNFEHLAEAGAGIVGELLARAPQLKCLVTSRQKLLLEGEQEFLLSPLPTSGGAQDPETLLRVASIALFVDRAQMVRPNFQVTAQNAATLAELCDQLEGIPLAIELAAARIQVLSAAHILEQIKANRLDFLATKRRDSLSRQRTLRSALDWSYRLLPEPAQRTLAQVSVFRGGWTLDAAQSVCRLGEADTLEMLGLLRDNSLLQVEDEEEGIGFNLLETVREYAAEQLERTGEHEALQRRHAHYFLLLVEPEKPGLGGPEEPAVLRRVSQEQSNFRAAVDWTRAAGEVVLRARLGVALFPYWSLRMGYAAELRQWLWDLRYAETDANPDIEAAIPPLLYASLQYVLGRCARILGDADEATALYNRSLQLFQQQGDPVSTAWVLLFMGVHSTDRDLMEAQKLFEEGLRLMRQAQHDFGIGMGLLGLTRVIRTNVIVSREEYERAQGLCAEAHALCHRRGDLYSLAEILVEEGQLARTQGEFARAKECMEENLALRNQLGDRSGAGKALCNLGHLAHEADDFVQARHYLEEALRIFQDCQWGSSKSAAEALLHLAKTRYRTGDAREAEALAKRSLMLYHKRSARSGYFHCLYFLSQVAASGNRPERVARLMGAADAMREVHGAAIGEKAREHLAQARALVVKQLGEARFAAEERIGRTLTEEQAIALALENAARGAKPRD
ncbi:MAG: DNA-binding transcriptional activator of the family [Chthonomonadaceae bacterium]|nr:DNA-binding transcriptional activator of the family [Chthonomonadaceae bacterium]